MSFPTEVKLNDSTGEALVTMDENEK
jgi:hypothetical protein